MKKKIVTTVISLLVILSIGVVLANNKAKIDKAAKPEKYKVTVPIKVYTAKEDSFNTSFELNGETAPDKEVKIASEVQGKLVNLFIKNGDIVNAGQVIAVLDASVYSVQLNSIESSIAKSKLDIARYSRLVEMGGATPMQVESAELQHKSLLAEKKQVLEQIAHMQIRAPFSGKIENVVVEKGSFVSFGTVLADLLSNSTLKINVYLSEQQAFKVKPGQAVTISSVLLAKSKTGKINMISDKADASGKFLTEINFSNTDKEKLKAGMIADVSFAIEGTETGLAIPVSALLGSSKGARVYVANGNKAELRSITTGIVTPSKVQVLDGLQPGEQVIISGQLNLENGTNITIHK